MFSLYVVPLSLIPPAMLLYAADAYSDRMLGNISMNEAWKLATLFFLAELAMVPLMGFVIRTIGDVVGARPEYHDAFAFAAVAPTPLWLSALALFVPSTTFNGAATVLALIACGVLIYEGTLRVFRLPDDRQSAMLTTAILSAGLLAWVSLMGLAFSFVGWSW
jgi:hypothetical protein